MTIEQGEGSAATVARVMSGPHDAGLGEVDAVVQNAAVRPAETLPMVLMVYNSALLAVLALADGPVRTVADLAGRELGSPAGSAAFVPFPAPAPRIGLDAADAETVAAAYDLPRRPAPMTVFDRRSLPARTDPAPGADASR